MKFKYFKFILIFIFIIKIFSLNSLELNLKLVQVITRHGARTPFTKIPGDKTEWNCTLSQLSIPNLKPKQNLENIPRIYRQNYIFGREKLPGNCSEGQLTIEGYLAHYELGKKFREHYINKLKFLNDIYDPKQVYIRSTDIPRTIQSAEAQILGFYPINKSNITEIINFESIESSMDDLSPNNKCPKMMLLCNLVQSNPEWIHKLKEYEFLENKLKKLWNVSSIPWWIGLFDAFYCRSFQKLPLPPGITPSIVQEITDIAWWQLVYLYKHKEIYQLGIGPFIEELLQNMKNIIKGISSPIWRLYSGHDVTIALILSSFNSLEQTGYWPPFASYLIFELLEDRNQNFFVHIIYNDKELILPNCELYCPFHEFEKITKNIIPNNWNQECNLQNDDGKFSNLFNKIKREQYDLKKFHLIGLDEITQSFC